MLPYKYNKIKETIEDFKKGKFVIVIDSKKREGEGDFIAAASKINPKKINFLLENARGAFIAVFTPSGLCKKLQIPNMLSLNNSFNKTNFRVSVDSIEGSSGSSAYDRAKTVKLFGSTKARPKDFVKPGHVIPIESNPGGILKRKGHTEAGVLLAKLAGFNPPVAVDLEILDKTGKMAKEKYLFHLAKRFNLKIISINSLIEFYEDLHP